MQNDRIPKVIHLMWFSGDPYPPLIAKCINSWHKIVPDYKIKLWTGDMIKDLDYKYLQDALKVKKYAFACDVVRAYALYTEGGVYMDSDVFLKRVLDMYKQRPFCLNDIKEWIIRPQLYASCAIPLGFEYKDNDQLLDGDAMVYHADLYNRMSKTAFAVHCGNGSWVDNEQRNKILYKCKELARSVLSKLHLYSWYYRYLKYDK